MLDGVLAFATTELLIIVPVCAFSDRIDRRPVFIAAALFTIAFAFPLFWLVNTKTPALILLGMGSGGVANGVLFGTRRFARLPVVRRIGRRAAP